MEPCTLCHRTVRQVVQGLDLEARRGRRPFCEIRGCPLYARWTGLMPARSVKGRSAYGPSPPSLFIGRFGYPDVYAGPLVPPAEVPDAAVLDRPAAWTKLELGDVLALRSGLVRASARVHIKDARRIADPTHAMSVSRELAMAERPAHTELTFTKDVDLALTPLLAGFAAPTGPRIPVERARLTENTVVPRRVDQLVDDVHARAATGAGELYRAGISSYHIQRLLSAGLLGRATDRTFVPTRWSVTATDDILGKQLLPDVRGLAELGEIRLHEGELHGNRFHVVLLPGRWRFEMAEAWMTAEPGAAGRGLRVLVDREPHEGRRSYAEQITGAYYAARLSVLEHLLAIGRQADAIVLREITDDYYAPAGVWVIREGVRSAMEARPRPFDSLEEALVAISSGGRLRTDWKRYSRHIDEYLHQSRLFDYF